VLDTSHSTEADSDDH